ncbi:BON domain-containing protein [Occallatibacter riparius]|uniref:BON domain-containing protein n=1 Tax=Occallatibacter riparius TaxID=1002689 RepID=A0A9J7BXX3_9BACT|nr:BON domain-containing protein [Occallatibacter riparius]UWZ86874.1 BON domain-containing protein [Occallatibacter riparius]
MNDRLNKIRFQVLATAAALALSGSVLLAQDAGTATGSRTDGQIEMDVVHALDASAALKNDLITAATIQGEVTLSGTVASEADQQLAESIAGKVAGVTKVNNKLRIGNPADDPNNVPPPDEGSAPVAGNQPDNQNPPSYSPSPDQAPQQGYPDQNQQAQNYPQQQQPQVQTPPPGTGQTPGQYEPPQGPGYARPGGPGPYYPPQTPPPGYAQPYGRGYSIARGPITILPGTTLNLRTNAAIDEKHAVAGQPLDFVVIQDVAVNGYLAIPRGAIVHGVVTQSKHAGQLTGSPELALAITGLDIDGRQYPLQSDEFRVKGPSKTGHTVGNAIGGALIGAIIGGAVGGGGGAAVGAVAGGGAGTAVSAAGGPHAWIPAEALVTFHLNAPVTVDPVSQEEAMRLAQGLYPGGPQLYRRGYYRPGYPPPPPGYYRPYGPVYYHPYVYSGGYYYWR